MSENAPTAALWDAIQATTVASTPVPQLFAPWMLCCALMALHFPDSHQTVTSLIAQFVLQMYSRALEENWWVGTHQPTVRSSPAQLQQYVQPTFSSAPMALLLGESCPIVTLSPVLL